MFPRNGFSSCTILGAPDLEAEYATILVVLATTATICYVAFMTSHRYRFIPSWTRPFRTRRYPHEPLLAKVIPVDLSASTCNEGHALADNTSSPLPSLGVLADPIAEPEVPLAEGEPRVLEDLPRPQPSSTSVQLEAPLEVDVSESEIPQAEDHQLEVDRAIAGVPLSSGSEVKSGASSSDTDDTDPPVVDIQETVYVSPQCAPDDSDDPEPSLEFVEDMVASPEAAVQTESVTDVEASISTETPFLLAVDATVNEERSSEDDTAAASLTCEGLAASVLELSPRSNRGSVNGDASSFIMQSALLVPAESVTSQDLSPSEDVAELEADDDWTAVDPDEPATPRPSTSADREPGMEELAGEVPAGDDDLAVSTVLLTRSQYASAILPPISVHDDGPSSPNCSSSSSLSTRSRVHTSDRPDWAVAPQDEHEDAARREQTLRRHSVDSPDWAVAPAASENGASPVKKKGRRSGPGSGTRRKSRRAWTSR